MIEGRGIPCRVFFAARVPCRFIFSIGQLRSKERFRTVGTVGTVETVVTVETVMTVETVEIVDS